MLALKRMLGGKLLASNPDSQLKKITKSPPPRMSVISKPVISLSFSLPYRWQDVKQFMEGLSCLVIPVCLSAENAINRFILIFCESSFLIIKRSHYQCFSALSVSSIDQQILRFRQIFQDFPERSKVRKQTLRANRYKQKMLDS